MKKRPKPCIKTLAILGCVAAVILSASAVVADVVMTRLMQGVRDPPEAAAPEPVVPAPP
jgi:hypothetical protein